MWFNKNCFKIKKLLTFEIIIYLLWIIFYNIVGNVSNDSEKNFITNEKEINNIKNTIELCETNNDLRDSKNDLVNETEEKI